MCNKCLDFVSKINRYFKYLRTDLSKNKFYSTSNGTLTLILRRWTRNDWAMTMVQKQTSYTAGIKLKITKYIDTKLSFTHIKPLGGTNGLGVASDEKDNIVALSLSGEFSNEDEDNCKIVAE